MSLDCNDLVRAVKRAAVDAVWAADPMRVCYGSVSSTNPLKITVDQKKVLGEAQLILTDAVRDFTVDMTPWPDFHRTEEEAGGSGDPAFAPHSHRYQGPKTWRVHNALKVGENVLLLCADGGQKYIVLDRWEART